MKLESIKKQLENEDYFKYWNKAIGLSFEDFSILVWLDDKTKYRFKEGKKIQVLKYAINIKDGVAQSFCFELNNDNASEYRLKEIAS